MPRITRLFLLLALVFPLAACAPPSPTPPASDKLAGSTPPAPPEPARAPPPMSSPLPARQAKEPVIVDTKPASTNAGLVVPALLLLGVIAAVASDDDDS